MENARGSLVSFIKPGFKKIHFTISLIKTTHSVYRVFKRRPMICQLFLCSLKRHKPQILLSHLLAPSFSVAALLGWWEDAEVMY